MKQIHEHLARLEALQYQELGFLIDQYTGIKKGGCCMRRFLNLLKDILEQHSYRDDVLHTQLIACSF
jgi:hypothetical protein